ncbi:MAG TPA: dihydrodipicolinate synthase family protein [Gemmatimonadaceae bacterium]|nr:dihydrodipicolinate synthase family protein [Gemmatimonadaceae bacterium]
MTLSLDGIFGAETTPFDARGDVDADAFAANIRAHLAAGFAGIVVAGSTGEAALLSEAERAALVDCARGAVPSDRAVIVGTGAESTRATIALTRRAAAAGADAVLVVAPHYYGPSMTADVLLTHYRAVADASPVPVILYSIPKYMHFALPATVVADLAMHENIIGIKDSSGNRDLLSGYLEAASADFAVLTGSGSLLRHALESGARGGILGVALFAPTPAVDVFTAVRAGDAETGARLQERLTPLNATIVSELGVAGVKAALTLVGLAGGPLRPPLMALPPEQVARVATVLRSAELVGA